jgi:hypothetical protein
MLRSDVLLEQADLAAPMVGEKGEPDSKIGAGQFPGDLKVKCVAMIISS